MPFLLRITIRDGFAISHGLHPRRTHWTVFQVSSASTGLSQGCLRVNFGPSISLDATPGSVPISDSAHDDVYGDSSFPALWYSLHLDCRCHSRCPKKRDINTACTIEEGAEDSAEEDTEICNKGLPVEPVVHGVEYVCCSHSSFTGVTASTRHVMHHVTSLAGNNSPMELLLELTISRCPFSLVDHIPPEQRAKFNLIAMECVLRRHWLSSVAPTREPTHTSDEKLQAAASAETRAVLQGSLASLPPMPAALHTMSPPMPGGPSTHSLPIPLAPAQVTSARCSNSSTVQLGPSPAHNTQAASPTPASTLLSSVPRRSLPTPSSRPRTHHGPLQKSASAPAPLFSPKSSARAPSSMVLPYPEAPRCAASCDCLSRAQGDRARLCLSEPSQASAPLFSLKMELGTRHNVRPVNAHAMSCAPACTWAPPTAAPAPALAPALASVLHPQPQPGPIGERDRIVASLQRKAAMASLRPLSARALSAQLPGHLHAQLPSHFHALPQLGSDASEGSVCPESPTADAVSKAPRHNTSPPVEPTITRWSCVLAYPGLYTDLVENLNRTFERGGRNSPSPNQHPSTSPQPPSPQHSPTSLNSASTRASSLFASPTSASSSHAPSRGSPWHIRGRSPRNGSALPRPSHSSASGRDSLRPSPSNALTSPAPSSYTLSRALSGAGLSCALSPPSHISSVVSSPQPHSGAAGACALAPRARFVPHTETTPLVMTSSKSEPSVSHGAVVPMAADDGTTRAHAVPEDPTPVGPEAGVTIPAAFTPLLDATEGSLPTAMSASSNDEG